MSSFTRTIPGYKEPAEVEQVLSQRDHFIPLTFRPAKARPGDFIYLVYQGRIIGRARIAAITPAEAGIRADESPPPSWARWLIRYHGSWEIPGRDIPVQGHQGVRYLEEQALHHLDAESW